MDWGAVSAIAGLLAAIFVGATVVYLALQVISLFRRFENVFFQYQSGRIDEDFWGLRRRPVAYEVG